MIQHYVAHILQNNCQTIPNLTKYTFQNCPKQYAILFLSLQLNLIRLLFHKVDEDSYIFSFNSLIFFHIVSNHDTLKKKSLVQARARENWELSTNSVSTFKPRVLGYNATKPNFFLSSHKCLFSVSSHSDKAKIRN